MGIKKWSIVGSFSKTLKGGTSTFCDLIFEKPFFDEFEFYFIDSTLDTIPRDSFLIRIKKSILKFKKLFTSFMIFKPGGVMLFAGHGLGLLEKFIILLFSKLLGKKAIFFPRSGLILASDFDKFIFYYAVCFSDKVVCQSEYWKTYIDKLNPDFDKKSVVIYNGIRPNNGVPKNKDNHKKFVILYVGWLESNKGILDLIDAVKYLNTLTPGIYELNILGKGSLESKIIKIIETFPELIIFYRGWVSGEDKSSFFQKSNCLVVPSYYEGFPNVVLEAMNNNLPVISSNSTSLPEILDNGNCGILFEPGNQKELVDAILHVQNFPREAETRARLAAERVNTMFDIEISKNKLKEVLVSM